MAIEGTIEAIPAVMDLDGQPRKRADKVMILRAAGIICGNAALPPASPVAEVKSKERLGRHRWVVERTHAWYLFTLC